MSINEYLLDDHVPHAKPVRELYADALEELAFPFPSIALSDFPKLNHITGGLRVREFSILCGATGVGKTTLLANISASLLKQNTTHFVASVETGPTDYVKRVISVLEDKDYNNGELVPERDLTSIHVNQGGLLTSDHLHLSLYDNRIHRNTLMADIAWHVENKGCRLAMIDNLNFFMETTSADNQVIEMDRVIHDLVIFCKKVDVHVIMVMHPKKTETGRVENEFDIKGSSLACQEAHNIFLYNRPHPKLLQQGVAIPSDRELKIQKMRRRGKFVGKTLLLNCKDSVAYKEGEVL